VNIDIKCRFSGCVLFSHTAKGNTIKATVEAAVSARADLARANLAGAYLADAYLAGAYLADAYLAGANLAGAYLAGAKWRNGIVINRVPLQLDGLRYPVTILDAHIQIGCELHTVPDWAAFDDERIVKMDGKTALTFWRAHKAAILALATSDGRGVETVAQEAA